MISTEYLEHRSDGSILTRDYVSVCGCVHFDHQLYGPNIVVVNVLLAITRSGSKDLVTVQVQSLQLKTWDCCKFLWVCHLRSLHSLTTRKSIPHVTCSQAHRGSGRLCVCWFNGYGSWVMEIILSLLVFSSTRLLLSITRWFITFSQRHTSMLFVDIPFWLKRL